MHREGNFSISGLPEFDHHEWVMWITDAASGLRGCIAIHNSNLGPATGGTRYWSYASEEEAVRDALRLSRAMTYKCALAGVPFGGGKGVIIAPKDSQKKPAILEAYAKKVETLQGFFSTGEDIGISLEDVKIMLQHSHHIIGKPDEAGDLGEITAKGVLFAMRAALKEVFGSESLEGRTVAIKGLGKVGGALAEFVAREGGKVIGAEVNEAALARARTRIPSLAVVPPQKIHRAEADIFAPCALGGDLNASTIPELRCKIVCGAANNQLASPEAGVMLHQRGILYIPDYLANAGGLINVTAELHKDGYSRERVEKKVAQIQQTAAKVIALAKRQHIPTAQAADALAEEIFLGRRNKKADT